MRLENKVAVIKGGGRGIAERRHWPLQDRLALSDLHFSIG